MTLTANTRTADHDVEPMFLERWSPRAFTAEPMPQELLMSLFEAARWAPSAFNGQPWRFVYAHRDTPHWERLFGILIPYNQAWVKNASVLMFAVSDRFRRAEGREPAPVYSHSFDAGAAWACLALEARAIGWAAHGMSGFDVGLAYEQLQIPEAEYRVEAAIAVGKPTGADVLAEPYKSRETPSTRKRADTFVFEGLFRVDGT
jgi:nitroreductase